MSLMLVRAGCRNSAGTRWHADKDKATLLLMRTQQSLTVDMCRGNTTWKALRSFSSNYAAGKGPSNMSEAQRRSYEFYQRKRMESPFYRFKLWWNKGKKKAKASTDTQDLNVQLAWYAFAIVVGVVGATYASVPLYKIFCQTTGFGGTTQRVQIEKEQPSWLEKMLSSAVKKLPGGIARKANVHTWTDEDAAARLSSLRPVANAELITVHFDTTVPDSLPWSFEAVQHYVKVVPGETALSFFRVTNHSDKAITGVATYNVHPPKVGLYFQKIQCFCFEEQRILPGETVDMPVFYFIDPEMLDDPQVSYVTDATLSYTFFPTGDEDDDDDDDDDDDKDE